MGASPVFLISPCHGFATLFMRHGPPATDGEGQAGAPLGLAGGSEQVLHVEGAVPGHQPEREREQREAQGHDET